MSIEELVPLTNGLSVPCGNHTLVCDRARITSLRDAIDMKFLIAGTDYMPRMRMHRDLVARSSSADVARMVRHVAQQAMGVECSA
jgi:hypothetical protein